MSHAVHTTNLASSNEELRIQSRDSLLEEALMAQKWGVGTLVFQ